jgi:hypothetical protein
MRQRYTYLLTAVITPLVSYFILEFANKWNLYAMGMHYTQFFIVEIVFFNAVLVFLTQQKQELKSYFVKWLMCNLCSLWGTFVMAGIFFLYFIFSGNFAGC